MRKIFTLSFFIVIVSLLFSSCGEKTLSKEFTPEKSFTLHMTALKDEKSFEADIICLNSAEITLSFTYPKELSGFSVKTEGDGYTVNVFGITDEVAGKEISNASLLNVLTKALRTSVFGNHGLFTETESGYTANLTIDGIPVTVLFSEDGFLQKMTSDTLNFSAQFEISG